MKQINPFDGKKRSDRMSFLQKYTSQLGLLTERHLHEAAIAASHLKTEDALQKARVSMRETAEANQALMLQIEKRQETLEELEYLANHDSLTDLPNRNLFNDRLKNLLESAKRSGLTLALMYLDLDRFKDVNDTLGHIVGDELLKAVADRLSKCVREEDTIARIGGDEFALIQVGLNYPMDARVQAKRILEEFAEPFLISEHKLFTGVSIGITVYPEDAVDSVQLQKNADLAMYLSKEEQRNTFRFFDSELNSKVKRRAYIEQELRTAIDRNDFVVYYQPKIKMDSGRVAGAEALIRWHHPEQGMISPDEFIPVSEQSGLINAIGEFVLESACAQFAEWHADAEMPDLTLAVNLSASQFLARDIPEIVQRILDKTGFEAKYLELEITETAVMRDIPNALDVLRKLHERGVSLSIDDFGTGYSSLSYLRQLPVNRLKIDKSFIAEVSRDKTAAEITRSVILLGKSLDLEIVAEGVETIDQEAYVKNLGCDEAQGFLYSRPISAANYQAFVLETVKSDKKG